MSYVVCQDICKWIVHIDLPLWIWMRGHISQHTISLSLLKVHYWVWNEASMPSTCQASNATLLLIACSQLIGSSYMLDHHFGFMSNQTRGILLFCNLSYWDGVLAILSHPGALGNQVALATQCLVWIAHLTNNGLALALSDMSYYFTQGHCGKHITSASWSLA